MIHGDHQCCAYLTKRSTDPVPGLTLISYPFADNDSCSFPNKLKKVNGDTHIQRVDKLMLHRARPDQRTLSMPQTDTRALKFDKRIVDGTTMVHQQIQGRV